VKLRRIGRYSRIKLDDYQTQQARLKRRLPPPWSFKETEAWLRREGKEQEALDLAAA
jgi:hypothetical protein